MYIARRVRDIAAIENIDAGGTSRDDARSGTGAVRFHVYNPFVGTDTDSRRDRAHRHGHTHR